MAERSAQYSLEGRPAPDDRERQLGPRGSQEALDRDDRCVSRTIASTNPLDSRIADHLLAFNGAEVSGLSAPEQRWLGTAPGKLGSFRVSFSSSMQLAGLGAVCNKGFASWFTGHMGCQAFRAAS